jgi:hypothetical protein
MVSVKAHQAHHHPALPQHPHPPRRPRRGLNRRQADGADTWQYGTALRSVPTHRTRSGVASAPTTSSPAPELRTLAGGAVLDVRGGAAGYGGHIARPSRPASPRTGLAAGRKQVTIPRTGQGAAKGLGYLAVAKMVAAPPSTVAVPTMNAPRESRTENREAWMAPLWPDCCPAESGR